MSKFPWKTTIAGAALLAATVYAYAQMSPGVNGHMGMHGQMSQNDSNDSMAQMHQQMMQGQGGMNGGMGNMRGGMSGAGNMAQMHEQMMKGQGGMSQGGMHGGMNGMGQHGGMNGMGMHGQQSGSVVPTMPGQDAFGTIQEVVQILEADPATDWSKVNIAALREHLVDMDEVTLHAAAAERALDNGIEIAVTGEGRTLAAIKRMVPAHVNELKEIGWNAKTDELPNGVKLTVTATENTPLTKLKALGFMGIMVQGGHHQPHHLAMAKGDFSMHAH